MAETSAWRAARARLGKLAPLIRIIDLERDEQTFAVLRVSQRDTRDMIAAGDTQEVLDGCTLIKPAANRTDAEIAEILARYDTEPDHPAGGK